MLVQNINDPPSFSLGLTQVFKEITVSAAKFIVTKENRSKQHNDPHQMQPLRESFQEKFKNTK